MVGVLLAGALAAATLGLGLHVNLSPSAPRGLYHAVAGTPTRGAWVAACVSPEAAALGRARGYLGAGPCIGGVQPVIKPVVALAGDVVELRPRLSTLADAVWGRHVVGADEFWLVSTRVPNSWDSRYLGPFSRSQVRAVAWPVWTWRRAGSEVDR